MRDVARKFLDEGMTQRATRVRSKQWFKNSSEGTIRSTISYVFGTTSPTKSETSDASQSIINQLSEEEKQKLIAQYLAEQQKAQ